VGWCFPKGEKGSSLPGLYFFVFRVGFGKRFVGFCSCSRKMSVTVKLFFTEKDFTLFFFSGYPPTHNYTEAFPPSVAAFWEYKAPQHFLSPFILVTPRYCALLSF